MFVNEPESRVKIAAKSRQSQPVQSKKRPRTPFLARQWCFEFDFTENDFFGCETLMLRQYQTDI